MRTVRAVVSGRVQGVGFRAWVEAEAETMGLNGWVRNRRDGTVEAVFAGEDEAVAQMLRALWDGPPAASVTSVVERPHTDAPESGFRTLPTA